MEVDDETGEILNDEERDEEQTGTDNVRPLRKPRRPPLQPGTRRTTMTNSVSDGDAKALLAHARTIEVEGASDRLGMVAIKESLESAEDARRGLTRDLIELKSLNAQEIDRVRDEYERAADASEARHAQEALRMREDRDKLRREIDRLERELKDAQKAKKKHKKSVASLELSLAQLREEGQSKRAVLGLLAPGVPPLANELARHVPDIFAFMRSALGKTGEAAVKASNPTDPEETILDRAAAIRFAGRLFEPQSEDVLEDLKRLAFNVVDEDGTTVVVPEWDRVQRYVFSAWRQEAEAANPPRVTVDQEAEG